MAQRLSQSAPSKSSTKWSGTLNAAAALNTTSPSSRVTRSSARLAGSLLANPTEPVSKNQSANPSKKRKTPTSRAAGPIEEPTSSNSSSSVKQRIKRRKIKDDSDQGEGNPFSTSTSARTKKAAFSISAMSGNGYDMSSRRDQTKLSGGRSTSSKNGDAPKSSSMSSRPSTSRNAKRASKGTTREEDAADSCSDLVDRSPTNEPAARRSKTRGSKKDTDVLVKENTARSQKPEQPAPSASASPGDDPNEASPTEAAATEQDAFAAALFGRDGPMGLSTTLRALSGMMSGMSMRLRDILNNLQQVDNPTMQLIALEELSNLLLVSNEDNLSGQFSPDPYVKELVALMQPNPITGEENPEIMLLACRCIANLMEALRGSVANVVYGGAVPVLCQKLLDIQYIDVAEQALSTLSKVSVDFPASIVREGGLTACLQFLDFFATGTQRTAVMTAANCCRNIPSDSFPVIRDVMPVLQNVLVSHDQKVVEQGCLCVTRIIDSFKRSSDKLEELVDPPLLQAILTLLLPGTVNLIGANIHTELLRVLAIVARSSPKLSVALLKMNVVDTLYQILTGVSPPHPTTDAASKIDSVVIMQALIHRPREQIYETLDVICELLPPPKFAYAIDPEVDRGLVGTSERFLPLKKRNSRSEQRLELLVECTQQTRRFAMILLPTLTDAYSSTVNLSVRQKVLTAQLEILSNLETSVIEEALRPVPYASFLASILSQGDHPSLVLFALQATELLLERLGSIYQYQFYREGVIGEIEKLAAKSSDPALTHLSNVNHDLDVVMKDAPVEGGAGRHQATENSRSKRTDIDVDDDDDDDDDDDNDDSGESALDDGLSDHNGDSDQDDGDDENGEEENDDDAVDDDDIIVRDEGELESASSDSSDEEVSPTVTVSAIKDLIVSRATKFLEQCDTVEAQVTKDKAQQIRNNLRGLADALVDHYAGASQRSGHEMFTELAKHFDGDALESITSSELLDSGVIRALASILSREFQTRGNPRGDFLTAFMGTSCSTPIKSVTASASPTTFTVLIQKLQDLLSRTEHFEVLTVNSSAAESSRSSSTSMLSRQIRMKLNADDDSEIPASFREMIVSIHAIATFKALDDYLRPRMSLSERHGFGQRRRDMLQQLANARMAQLQNAADSGFLTTTGSESSTKRGAASQQSTVPSHVVHEQPNDKSSTGATSKRRSARRSGNAAGEGSEPIAPETSFERSTSKLECADEKPMDRDTPGPDVNNETLDAIVGELEEDGSDDGLADPAAVNMEFGSAGKVLARREDGSRVFTPQQPGTPVQTTAKPPAMQSPSSMSFQARDSSRALSYAAALTSVPQDWHIEFSIDDAVIPQHTTIYRAVHHNRSGGSDGTARSVWSAVHAVKFRKVKGPPPSPDRLDSGSEVKISDTNELPASLNGHPVTSSILTLLGILHELNAGVEELREALDRTGVQLYSESPASFINTKLTAKMNRQLEEPLIVASDCLPSWSEDLARSFPFLFPFETRHLFLQSTSFGYSRSIIRWQSNQEQSDERRDRRRDDRPLMGRPQRQKVRISRSRILESAMKVMEMYGASPSVLEVEYFEEVGTGLGPTLEFYSTVSKEFCKKKFKLWRENDSNEKDVYAFGKEGLFPAPMKEDDVDTEAGKKLLHFFKMLGKFVARSMLDSRIIDINFSPTFFKVGSNGSATPSIALLRTIDSDLANSLAQLQQYGNLKAKVESEKHKTAEAKDQALAEITVGGAHIEDLALDFTLPGYPKIELIPDGTNVSVALDNVDDYIQRVLNLSLKDCVRHQIEAFETGFSQVFSYSSLKAFSPNELVMLFGRVEEDWSLETLMDSVKADHGFNMDSKSVKNLLQVMSEFTKHQRRDFLQFVTGSPKLPIGGFKSLTPMFTVVCKASEAPYTSDDYLPSVMTCVNYLKLPDYSSQDMMKKRLQVAIREGQGAFHLS